MEQSTANALAQLLGMGLGKIGGDFQEVQQAKQQRAMSQAMLGQQLKNNQQYLNDPLISKLAEQASVTPSTGELFKKAFFGATPEIMNQDLAMLQSALGFQDKQQVANAINKQYSTYNPEHKALNYEQQELLNNLKDNQYYKRSEEDANMAINQRVADWMLYNQGGIGKLAEKALKPNTSSTQGEVTAIEQTPFGLTPDQASAMLKNIQGEQGSNLRNDADNKTSMRNTDVTQAGATQRTAMNNQTSRANNQTTQAGAMQRTLASLSQAGKLTSGQILNAATQASKDITGVVDPNKLAENMAIIQKLLGTQAQRPKAVITNPNKPKAQAKTGTNPTYSFPPIDLGI
jgi:hypothetical protein